MRSVVVETGLSEETVHRGKSFTRHARTRFVDKPKVSDFPAPPVLGDPFDPVTVRARLQRMAEVFRRMPHDPDTRPGQHRSCMPTPVREIFKDLPGEPMRVPVARVDLSAAKQVLDSLITFKDTDNRLVVWAIAAKLSHRRLGIELRCDHKTAAARVQAMLAGLVIDWNARGWRPDEIDIANARMLIHRNIK